MSGGVRYSTVCVGSVGKYFSSAAGECGCSNPGPNSGPEPPAVERLLQRLVACFGGVGMGGGGGGFATRVSSNVRAQDPGGGGGCNTDHRSPERSYCMD